MSNFKSLFGLAPEEVKTNVLVTPFLSKGWKTTFKLDKICKGKPYTTAQHSNFTFIHSGIGATFVGDAILHLKETPCQNIFFLGACGILPTIKNLNIADLVLVKETLAIESFSQVLESNFQDIKTYQSDESLNNNFLKNHNPIVTPVTNASFGSLLLEEDNLPLFEKHNIQTVDMECSAFLSASQKIKRRALALLFITDIIINKPFHRTMTSSEQTLINNSMKKAIDYLIQFTENN